MIADSLQDFKNNLEFGKRILGLDIGDAKIGIAVSDLSHNIANPREVLRRKNIKSDIEFFNNFIKQEEICAIVAGLPLSLQGEETEYCAKIRKFIDKINKDHSLPVFFQDERMSTSAVTRILKDSGMTRKKRDAIDDKMAAAYILQIVLDSFL